MRFKDKIVLITGSTRGIGKATALAFAKEGAKLIINYSKSKEEAEKVVKEINNISKAISIKCNVSNEKQVKRMFEKIIKKFGRLDILINNAGAYTEGDEWNGSSKIWEKTLKQNLISAMNTSKYATNIFQKQKSGIIVNIASRHGISGHWDALAYSASKAGIISITQSYAKLLAQFGGRANAVSPGAARSGYWLTAPKDELDAQISSSPLKRLIEPEEIAKEVLFLASEDSKDLNGKNISLDGERKVF